MKMQFQVVWTLMYPLVYCQDTVQEMCFIFSIWGYGMSLLLPSKAEYSDWGNFPFEGENNGLREMYLEVLENSGVNQA